MEPTAALSASAQIAVAIAGFAGVVAAFRNDSVHDWSQVENFWLRLLLITDVSGTDFEKLVEREGIEPSTPAL
jgi:hypothetical protein